MQYEETPVVAPTDPTKRGLKDNHPSGDATPSEAVAPTDPTKRGLKEALGIIPGPKMPGCTH